MLKAHPTSYPSREADTVTATFIADIHSRLPALCGSSLINKYSSKAFTPTVGLQPLTATGAETTTCMSRAVNLKPGHGSQLPKPANLRYYSTSSPSVLSSQQAHTRAHVANLPTHSASLGAQPTDGASKSPPKKRPRFDTLDSGSSQPHQSHNVANTLVQPASTTTPTTSVSTRPGLAPQPGNATSTKTRQSTTTSTGIVNIPSPMETPSICNATRHRVSSCIYMYVHVHVHILYTHRSYCWHNPQAHERGPTMNYPPIPDFASIFC